MLTTKACSRFVIVFACLSGIATTLIAQQPSENVTVIDGIQFTLADGLSIEKVADRSLVKWPIVADWDNQGRLVVAESGGVSKPIIEHNEKKLHKIIRLVDIDHDGTFDQRIVAAEDLEFPEGVLCVGNDILVAAPPVIWKLTDADQDGVCEKREVWFDGQTITGCANDLHGPYLGPDGWIYWCKGAFAKQTHSLLDGRTIESSAAHIYRRKLAGGDIEQVITGGMDNPVEVAFTPEGEAFFTSTFLQHPHDGLRDGIAHAVYGGVYGKEHSVLEGHPRTGPLMPIMTQLGPAAPSGLACLHANDLIPNADPLGTRFLVAALFNLQKVTAHQLIPHGGTFRSVDHDLVVADRVDFHPTDVLEDADGSLIVIDTGGWYDLCCPTSRIDQTTAAGGIYRIANAATKSVNVPSRFAESPRGRSYADHVNGLFDKRPWVRRDALLQIADAGDAVIPALDSILNNADRSLDDRIAALWALSQLGTAKSKAIVRKQLRQNHPSLLQAATHAVSIHRDPESIDDLQMLLDHADHQVRRTAAEAIGRLGLPKSVNALLGGIDSVKDDRHLEHSLIFAIIEIARSNDVDLLTIAQSDAQRRAVLMVLDRVDRCDDIPLSVWSTAFCSNAPGLRQTAAEIMAKHPRWAPQATEWLEQSFANIGREALTPELLARVVAGWKHQQVVQDQITHWIRDAAASTVAQQTFLASHLHEFTSADMPHAWVAPLAAWLAEASPDVQLTLADSLRQTKIDAEDADALANVLRTIAVASPMPRHRFDLLASLPVNSVLDNPVLGHEVVTAFLSDNETISPIASRVLQRVKLSDPTALVDSLPDVPAQRLTTAIEAVHRSGIVSAESAMLTQLASLRVSRTLPAGFLTNLYRQSSKELRALAIETEAKLQHPTAEIQTQIEARLSQLKPGDPVRGLQVFRSSKAACSGCHRIGYVGATIGPELTRIGSSRTPAALMEAVLFPSARQEQSYQGTRVLTVDGQVYNGLVRAETGEGFELQLTADRTVKLEHRDVELSEPSDVSIMPAGLADQLTNQELSDLMALLRSAK
ncbi:DUF7133 domain-containing protein [Novipirellula caenicola]|uniref:Cytochrome c domain-containing protein n=1 Tax=Novipirellula caenicola TaxID=1536901 RepID=A0ABP9VYV7_9BACT